MSIPTFPPEMSVLETQVAGHTFQDSSVAIGMLKAKDENMVLKSQTKKICAEREKAFYERIKHDATLVELKSLVPEYFGTRIINIRGSDVEFLQLKDLTAGMAQPCVLDCKIGKRTWDPLASDEKRLAESSKYLGSREAYGFCIPGFQVYSLADGKIKRYGREYGKSLDESSVYGAFKIFLNADVKLFRPLVETIHNILKDIQAWTQKQRIFKIYSSSVLIIYDAMKLKEHIENRTIPTNNLHLGDFVSLEEQQTNWINVKMIDFAHIFPNEDGQADENYLAGIKSLTCIFEKLLDEAS